MAKKRGHGEGSVYKNPDGRWHGQVSLPNGKRKNVYGKTQREVQQKVAQIRREIEAGMHGTTAGEQTLRQFAADWVAYHQTRRSNTVKKYHTMLKFHLDTIGDIPLSKLKPADIQAHYTRKITTLAPTTVHHIHEFIHVVLEQAVRLGVLGRNPSDYAEPPALKPKEMLPLNNRQVHQLLQALAGHRDEALFTLALATGMREAELLGLRWDNIDWERARVRCRATLHRVNDHYVLEEMKSIHSRRTLPLPATTIAALRRWREMQAEERAPMGTAWMDEWDLIFTTPAGLPTHPTVMLKKFRAHLDRAGLPLSTRVHDLRHTFATLLLERGVHIKAVSEMLGHSSVKITLDTYGHVTPRIQDTALEEISDILRLPEGHEGDE